MGGAPSDWQPVHGQAADGRDEGESAPADHSLIADAVAKKEAAERKARAQKLAKEREKARQEAASHSTRSSSSFPVQSTYTAAEVQAMARQIVPADQFQCFSNIVERESSWNQRADNPTSDAHGLVQALPGSKMSSAGADWMTRPPRSSGA